MKKMTKEQKKIYRESPEYKFKKNRNLQYVFNVFSWLTLIAPDCVLVGIKRNEWIVTQTDAVSVGIGFTLCAIISVFLVFKKFKDGLSFNGLTSVIGFWVGFAICILLQSILQELTTILLYTAVGVTASFCCDIGVNYFKKQKEFYRIQAGMEETSKRTVDFLQSIKETAQGKKGKDNYTPVD